MRVYELAKELNISSKDIADVLDTADKKYTSMNGLSDEEVSKIRSRYGKKNETPVKAESKPESKPDTSVQVKEAVKEGTASGNQSEVKKEEPKVSQVFFPQNSSKGGRDRFQNNRNGNDHFDRNNSRGDRNGSDRNNGNRFQNNGDRFQNNGPRFANGSSNGDRFQNNGDKSQNNGFRGNRDNNSFRSNGNRDNNFNSDNRRKPGDNSQGGRTFNGQKNDRFNNSGNGNGFRSDRPGNGQGGFKNNDRPGSQNGQGRRNDRRDGGVKEEFVFESKPDSRRSDWGKDNHKNDRKKDVENKENLKFASGQMKKPVKKEEKKEDTIKQLILPDTLTIKELADKMKVQPSVVVKKLFMQGKIVTINQEIDYDTAEEIALEFNCICDHEEKVDVIAELLKEDEEPEGSLVPRPPVVCVMGHVDHGKTSLLDAIRETHVTAKESGGITQKIGAYTVDVNGQSITFLDTPGHEAFTAMRMRGAQATDIAILVVAADDGVMPQTIEAINHAKAAGVEIIVAVNKIDKPNANVEKVKQELTEYGLISEDWGGSTTFVPVSAHTKEGIDELLDMILLTAEVNELKANPNRKARGIVIEAELDKGRGPVATILVQKGTLKVGDNVAAGASHGKIRAMVDDKGRRL